MTTGGQTFGRSLQQTKGGRVEEEEQVSTMRSLEEEVSNRRRKWKEGGKGNKEESK